LENKLLWLTFDGLEKAEILKELGFEINDAGLLLLNGKLVKKDSGDAVKANSVKAIVPGSLSVFTDVSEVEDLLEEE
jgi:hypothetical protein